MFYTKVTNKKKLKKFKERTRPTMRLKQETLRNKNYLYFAKGGLLELRLYKLIIRRFRRKLRRKRYKLNFFFLPNYAKTRKSKNARMGKGKGKFQRYLAQLRSYHTVAIIQGFGYRRLVQFFRRVMRYNRDSLVVSRRG